MFLEKSFGRVADRIDGLRVWFRPFEDLVAKKIQYGDLHRRRCYSSEEEKTSRKIRSLAS